MASTAAVCPRRRRDRVVLDDHRGHQPIVVGAEGDDQPDERQLGHQRPPVAGRHQRARGRAAASVRARCRSRPPVRARPRPLNRATVSAEQRAVPPCRWRAISSAEEPCPNHTPAASTCAACAAISGPRGRWPGGAPPSRTRRAPPSTPRAHHLLDRARDTEPNTSTVAPGRMTRTPLPSPGRPGQRQAEQHQRHEAQAGGVAEPAGEDQREGVELDDRAEPATREHHRPQRHRAEAGHEAHRGRRQEHALDAPRPVTGGRLTNRRRPRRPPAAARRRTRSTSPPT